MQRALWTSQRLHPDAPVQNMALLTHLDGPVDPERLAASFELVIAASDVLRTRIVADDGSPRVHLDAEAQPRTILELPRAEAETWARARASTPIDVGVRPYDSAILVHEDATVSWYLALHHTITDATSSSLVFDATAAVYHGERIEIGSYYRWARLQAEPDGTDAGGAATAEPAARWAAQAIRHWRDRRPAGAIDRLYRPVRRARPEATRLDVSLDESLAALAGERLQSDYRLLSPDLGWSALLMTATAAYLSALSGSAELTIGLPVHNRSDEETRDLIGPVMEVFPVDISVEAGMTFRELHTHVGKAIMATLANAAPG
ncbi:MAG: condensation domain-containing protein, partial [Acidimicrobiia bacterium]|nr:condensation domain-containing protein [Acidimicrobiia bacterium]